VHPAYLSQEVTELPAALRLLEAVEEVARTVTVDGVDVSASQLAERFGFGPDRQWTPVADLSGGERRRLQLLRLLMAGPNVLLLDEPTNDLDIDTLTALEDLLDSWPGSVVIVSHDRYLVERVCDTVVALLGDGSLAALPGGVEDYLARRRTVAKATVGGTRTRRGDSRGNRKELARLERRLATLDRSEARLHRELAAHATDYDRVAELDAELREIHTERDTTETEWLELSDDSAG
jgi:ATP-binding cassette subfamily F protein uup